MSWGQSSGAKLRSTRGVALTGTAAMIRDWAPCRCVQECKLREKKLERARQRESQSAVAECLGVPRPQQRQPGTGGHNAANNPADATDADAATFPKKPISEGAQNCGIAGAGCLWR